MEFHISSIILKSAAYEQEKYVLLHNFGSLAVGDNIDNAFNYLAWMESVTRKITLASMIGELHTIG